MPIDRKNREHITSRHRLRGGEYSTAGFYFITVNTYLRQPLFAEEQDGEIRLTPQGTMIRSLFQQLPSQFSGIRLDCWAIMPDHFHLLVYLPIENETVSASEVVRWIKGVAVAEYRRGVTETHWPRYQSHLWQVGFNDQIVRNDKHLDEVRRYISENPIRWTDRSW